MLCPFERRLMNSVTIRTVGVDDLPGVAALWHERMMLQQQADRRFALAPDALTQWLAAANSWLGNSDCIMLAAEHRSLLVGYAIGWMQSAPPGMLPERIGVVSEMHVGVHSSQSGLGRALLDSLRAGFAGQGAAVVTVHVPRRQPVEQAFWRALGATEWIDVMWVKL
jgi:hypothetical protein